MSDNHHGPHRPHRPPTPPPEPEQRFRVEGLARRGRVLHAHVIGRPGHWRIYGSAGFRMEVHANTVQDVLRIAGRRLPFRPIAVRQVNSSLDQTDPPDSTSH